MEDSEKIKQIKRDILQASYDAGACHLGSSFSCVEILYELLYKTMTKDDLFIFSKASGAATYYAMLADRGHFPKDKLAYYLKNFPESSKDVPGVLHSIGSVGHGLSIAAGLAQAKKMNKEPGKVYVLCSDGEMQEGVSFEAALYARQHKLDNLHVIVDNNKLQACGATKDILDLETAWDFYKATFPSVDIVDTVKGAGISFMEGDYNWHYKNLTPELLKRALDEV